MIVYVLQKQLELLHCKQNFFSCVTFYNRRLTSKVLSVAKALVFSFTAFLGISFGNITLTLLNEYELRDQNITKTLHHWKNVCQGVLRDQPQPGSLFSTTREAEKRVPGKEVEMLAVK